MDPQTPVPQAPSTDVPAQPASQPESAPVVNTITSQIVSTLNNAKNVLVTVGANPPVDELASALGLTALLGKIGKHATAVFSGKIPPAMEFLDPEKTFEDTVDSLRDFIIALDKEKADKLRYKVEDDVVKIFITPYKTVISEKDLQFSQGDFNVDVVVALGVQNQEELDKAITMHGRILHDATVVSINAGSVKSNIGTVDWNDPEASSIAEMLVSLSEQLGSDILDAQISTAFLTGIVAETNRFSNEKTSPKVMTLAAQLMASGANQQLIATNLRQEGMISEPVRSKKTDQPDDDSGEMVLKHEDSESDSKSTTDSSKSPAEESLKKSTESNEDSKQNAKTTDSSQGNENNVDVKEQEELTKEDSKINDTLEPAAPLPLPLPPASSKSPAPEPQKEVEANLSEPASQTDTGALPEAKTVADQDAINSPPAMNVADTTESALPTISHPSARNAMTPPQFGGTLNATQIEESEVSPEPTESQTTLEHQNDGVIGSDDAIEAARKAVEDAAVDPPHKRLESIGSTPLPEANTPNTESQLNVDDQTNQSPSLSTETPSQDQEHSSSSPNFDEGSAIAMPAAPPPMNGFEPPTPIMDQPMPAIDSMNSDVSTNQTDMGANPAFGNLPPLPPMPGGGDPSASLPPMPPLPGSQPVTPPMQPQTSPDFMQAFAPVQNSASVTDAQAPDERQAKINERLADYDLAVDRNRELQGLPPVNNPNGSGLPPLPPLPPTKPL